MSRDDNRAILCRDDDGKANLSVLSSDDDVWMMRAQMADSYRSSSQEMDQHIDSIYEDGGLDREATIKDFFIVRKKGRGEVERNIDHYDFDVIIAMEYRIQSLLITRFRHWATRRFHECIQKSFSTNDDKPQDGGNRCYKELFQRIRNIRASERNFHHRVTAIQNKLHYAVHGNRAAEPTCNRAKHEKTPMDINFHPSRRILHDH